MLRHLRFEILGGLRLRRDGAELAIASQRKALALLARLAVAGPAGTVTRDALLALLWPESDTDRARNALKQSVSLLRRELMAELVLGTAELRLNPDVVTVDLWEFEAALGTGDFERALAAYNGPFLDGIHIRDGDEFGRWADETRARLADKYTRCGEAAAAAAEVAGDMPRAVLHWRRQATADPLSARVVQRLMQALSAAGDREAALKQARVYEMLVRQELGVAPDPAVEALADTIRRSPAEPAIPPRAMDVSSTPAPSIEAPDDREADLAARSVAKTPPQERRWRGARVRIRAGTLAVLGIAISASAVAALWHRTDVYQPQRVVVAPFENATGDTTLAVLGYMAADWVAQGLAHTGTLDVVDARALSRESRRVTTPLELAHETQASTLVRGTIYRDRDTLVFQASIIDTRDEHVVRAIEPVRSAMSDAPGAGLDRLRQRVMGVFAALSDSRLTAWATSASEPPSYAAYTAFVHGLQRIGDGEGTAKAALPFFQQAALLDSSFVQARFMEAEMYDAAGRSREADSVAHFLLSSRERLAPYDRAQLDQLVAYLDGQWPAVLEAAREQERLAPRSPDAQYTHGWAAVANNYFEEAARAFERLPPNLGWLQRHGGRWLFHARAYHFLGRHDRELALVRESRKNDPQSSTLCLIELNVLSAMGKTDEAIAIANGCSSLPELSPAQLPQLLYLAALEFYSHGHAKSGAEVAAAGVDGYRQRNGSDAIAAPLAQLLRLAGRGPEALVVQQKVVRHDLSNGRARITLGVLGAEQGDRMAATAALNAVDSVLQDPTERNLQKARILAAIGDRDKATAYVKAAVQAGLSPALRLHADGGLFRLVGYGPFDELMRPRR